jgi:carboxyl-terminal processing protease
VRFNENRIVNVPETCRTIEQVFVRLAMILLLPLSGTAKAQQNQDHLTVPERSFIAAKIYSCIQLYFAHQPEGADFDSSYKAYLKQALAANDRREFDLATLEFIAKLRNKHTQFDDQWLQQEYGQPLPFSALFLEGKWVITSSQNTQLKRGDVIRSVDGVAVEALSKDIRRFINASSERSANNLVFDRPYLFPKRFTLEVEDGRKIAIERTQPQAAMSSPGPPASEGRWLSEGSVGYIKITAFNDPKYEKTAIALVNHYRTAKSLIIDVRSNGGGRTPFRLIEELMDREWRGWSTSTQSIIGLNRARGEPSTQLRIPSDKHRPRSGAFSGRLILLIDRFTCSAAEDFVMPFKDNGRAIIIGETSEGSSGQPYFTNFGNGMSLLVGAARHTFPDGAPFEGIGIKPTVHVETRIADIRAGVDPVLTKAKEMAEVP